jgi:type IV secretion system protein VirB1
MNFSAAAIAALATQCAPNVAPQTVVAIVQTESRGNSLALNVNGARQPARQLAVVDAATTARRYIAAGYSVDLGLGQINSRNMRKLGLTWETVFDPCTNIAALGQVLTQSYQTVIGGRRPQIALRLAISLYNTGSPLRGFRNGYVAKVVGNAGVADGVTINHNEPAASSANAADFRSAIIAENAPSSDGPIDRPLPPPTWNVFARAAYTREALSQTATKGMIRWTN